MVKDGEGVHCERALDLYTISTHNPTESVTSQCNAIYE